MHIVLYQPEIPHNTGAIGRLALATGSVLHLIKPLGFSLDEKAVRRAGLDYWKDVSVQVWDNWDSFISSERPPEARLWFVSTKGAKTIWETSFQKDDYLIFGPETRGLPTELLQENSVTIPMVNESTRSLNLATAVSIVLYEAVRQTGL